LEVLSAIEEISESVDLPIANLLHAGDGNLHPAVLFDERDPDELRRALHAGGEILKLCVASGGVLSGEHGIGLEKQEYMPLMFSDADMHAMAGLADAFESGGRFNPGKIFPTGHKHELRSQVGSVSRLGAGAYL
jgi:glycolate oxidase